MLMWIVMFLAFLLLLGTVGPWVFLLGLWYLMVLVGLAVAACALVFLVAVIIVGVVEARKARAAKK